MHVFLTWRTKKLARSLKFEPNYVTNLQTVMSKSINLKVRPQICVSTLITFCQLNTILVRDHEQDAVLMYRESIMIQSQIYGSEHLSVANSLHNLGNCYRDLSDFDKSFDCLSRSLSLLRIFVEDENEEVADTCHCLALTLVRKCELDEASWLFERALTIRKKKLGAMDLNVASSTYNLAVIHQMRGAWSTAMKHCKEAVRIQKMTVGDNNAITANTIECIGRIHMDKREFEDSIQCFRKCISQDKPMLQRECGSIDREASCLKPRKISSPQGCMQPNSWASLCPIQTS